MNGEEVSPVLTIEELKAIKTSQTLKKIARQKGLPLDKAMSKLEYENQLRYLQAELNKLQLWVYRRQLKVCLIFEGRDAAGKGGAIRRFMQYMNPRNVRLVALGKPTYEESRQWYLQRYTRQMPNPGEIVFFDRSWYNRAVVEPAMGFCTRKQYHQHLGQIPEFEHMLYEAGVSLVKIWFSVSKAEQHKRFKERDGNTLKQWKLSPVDLKAQQKWASFTRYKWDMFAKTHTDFAPWHIIDTDIKTQARLESIRHILNLFEYQGKPRANPNIYPDPSVVKRYSRLLVEKSKNPR